MSENEINLDMQMEQLTSLFPASIRYFIIKGLSAFTCSGAQPVTIGEYLERREVSDPEDFISGLKSYLEMD